MECPAPHSKPKPDEAPAALTALARLLARQAAREWHAKKTSVRRSPTNTDNAKEQS